MWIFSFSCCRRRCQQTLAFCSPRRYSCCRRRYPKEKGDTDGDVELGKAPLARAPLNEANPPPASQRLPHSSTPNGQDADEPCAGNIVEVPSWQIPELVVECSQRPGVRIHKGTSLILPEAGGELLTSIVAHLPSLLQLRPRWKLGYSMAVDGVSLRTMYRQLADAGPCILVMEDSSNCIFGAFLSEGLRNVTQCYGTHECFVFKNPRTAGAWRTEVYRKSLQPVQLPDSSDATSTEGQSELGHASKPGGFSSEKAGYFEDLRKLQAAVNIDSGASVLCNHNGLVVGIDGPALFVDQDLLRDRKSVV